MPQVRALLSSTAAVRYHEPFLGGGSMFFGLQPTGPSFLSDLNGELMVVYREVRDDPDGVSSLLSRYENSAESYYEARSAKPSTTTARAARFIFLNHTSFNGIYRVNLKGEYNVPFGRRPATAMPDLASLRAASQALDGVKLRESDFESALDAVEPGDLVFLDPPYTVAHNNNGFVKYNQHLFSFDDQKKLASAIKRLRGIGARFVLTNAAHASISDLFSPLGRRLTVSRRNVVGGTSAGRGRADEYLFTNIGES